MCWNARLISNSQLHGWTNLISNKMTGKKARVEKQNSKKGFEKNLNKHTCNMKGISWLQIVPPVGFSTVTETHQSWTNQISNRSDIDKQPISDRQLGLTA